MRPRVVVPLLLFLTGMFLFLLFQSGSKSVTEQDRQLHPHAGKTAKQASGDKLQSRSVSPGWPMDFDLDWADIPVAIFTPQIPQEDLFEEAKGRNKRDGGYRFATPIAVSLTPKNSGRWDRTPEGNLRWRVRGYYPVFLLNL